MEVGYNRSTAEAVKAMLLAVPEVAAWRAMVDIIEGMAGKAPAAWELPGDACRAVGGDVAEAVPGAAAVACQQISIILVDDMLDEDPRGAYRRLGVGPASNLALAFQAVAFRVLEKVPVKAGYRDAITSSLAWLGLATALGQNLDAQNYSDEANYWRVVQAKSSPFYGSALHIGALLGEAPLPVAAAVRNFGLLLGEIIQIHDDLADAFHTPANPDWLYGRNNLPILYALIADHPQRARFKGLLSQVDDPSALGEAQQILVSCGAVSYCVYHLVKRQYAARELLQDISLVDREPLVQLVRQRARSVIALLRAGGAELPAELLSELDI